MAAQSTNDLLAYAVCYLCYGVSLTDALKLALWDQIAQKP